jgi:hypothetical protein
MSSPPGLVRTIEELEPAWLAEALDTGPVGSFSVSRIGTGQMSQSYRILLDYSEDQSSGPRTIVVKLAASDETSRSTGVGLGIYEREIRFYRELAPRIGGPLPLCHYARYDAEEGWFTLVLEDVAPAVQGDEIAGCGVDQARLAMLGLARLHAPVFDDPGLGDTEWLNESTPVNQALVSQLLPAFFQRYGERISAEHRTLCERFIDRLDPWLADRTPPLGLVHGDFRLDNLLFGDPQGAKPLTVVDWQTVGWGGALNDASYFLGGALPVSDRRTHEQELLREYHDSLVAQGVRSLGWEKCWEGYRRRAVGGVLMAIVASMLVERTERGDEMFMTMLARHAQHALDLDALELLPAPASSPPLRPATADEGRHEPGPERLWNESWYFDVVSRDGAVGGYVRIGLYPSLNTCWYTAFVCGPDRPSVAVLDFAAPLPAGDGLRTQTDLLRADHVCESPLERFRVQLVATGEAHDDPAAILRGDRGQPVPLALDLVWDTAGVPYAYRLTTRYEIPCAVSGTITVGEETLTLRGAPGQRDHSWGLRDWWSMDWVWMAGHLDDETHLHAVELRLAGNQRLGVGYVQSAAQGVQELTRVAAAEERAADGLITTARLDLDPPGTNLDVEPLAFGPVLLVSDDGRVSHFPRAMCRLRASGGRIGVAWVEWNLNQPDRAGPAATGPAQP